MAAANKVPDKTLLQNVNRKLIQKVGGSSRVSAQVKDGNVTISGSIKREDERKPILRCLAGVQGIKRVIDQIQIEKPRPKTM